MRTFALASFLFLAGLPLFAQPVVPPANAEIQGALAPGQTQVLISLPSGATADQLFVRVNNGPAGLKDSTGSNVAFIVPDLTKLQAMITLAVPLAPQDLVTICLFKTGTLQSCSPEVTVVDPLDLGRIRYYFTAGVVLSNNQGFQVPSGGTQAGLFLGMDVDRSWLAVQPRGARRIGLNTYFDARLTSVATEGVSSATGTTTNSDVFLQSKKAAVLQSGIYLPVMLNEFQPAQTPMAFYIAPIGKVGFSTLTDDTATTASTAGTQNSVVAGTGRFFTFYSMGTRLGVTKVHKNRHGDWDPNISPESIGYFDVTYGRFGNFEAFRDLQPQLGGVANTQFQTERPWRFSFEGIVKIPPVFVIGFSANVGRGAPPAAMVKGTSYPFTPPHDDLRFLFGAQFDFRQILKKLPSF